MNQPIRILHIVTYMGRGGLETMLMNYYRNIDRNKVQFDFLVHRDFEADYDQEILSLGGKIHHISRLIPWSSSYKKELKQFFKKHSEYKIVHVHQDCLSSVALKCAKECNMPVRIAHSHNANQDRNVKYLFKKYYMRSIPKYATHLFSCGKDAGDWMFGGAKYQILNNAIQLRDFIFNKDTRNIIREEFKLKDELVIGHVGRFNYQKNHEYLICIFNEIHHLNKKSKLVLVGSGDLENIIKEKVHQLNLDDSVLFLGNRSNVNEIMQSMDVFVFPSHYEGLPVTLVEAQASGLPIFISNNIPNQCKLTKNIWSISLSKSPKEWAETILRQTRNYDRKNMLSEIVDSGYDIESNSKKLEEFYCEQYNNIK